MKILLFLLYGLLMTHLGYAKASTLECQSISLENQSSNVLKVQFTYPNFPKAQIFRLCPNETKTILLQTFRSCNEAHPNSKIRCLAMFRQCHSSARVELSLETSKELLFTDVLEAEHKLVCTADTCTILVP
ncbi:MAG TPA: hypothetical protein VHD33_03340 [Legionellaceae bacterium]|nr:hypothetical protein [Legionellaceae bacterium]